MLPYVDYPEARRVGGKVATGFRECCGFIKADDDFIRRDQQSRTLFEYRLDGSDRLVG